VSGFTVRIMVSLMGLVIAGLSVTGVYLWWVRRAGRGGARPAGEPAEEAIA